MGCLAVMAEIMKEHLQAEEVVWRCSVEKVFLEILQNSLENTCTRGLQLY